MTDQPLRACAYVRVSTAQQAKEGLSLDEQQRNVEKFIADQGWEHAGTFVEAGVSGRRDDRPKLAQMLAQVVDFDAVVIPKLDRLGRSTRHLLETVERLERAGVRLVSLRDHIDTSTPSGRLLLRMLASVAEFESDMIGERVASVTTARAQHGHHHGRVPYGYYSAGEGLQIVDDQAAVIRRIFSEYVAGTSQREICRRLNREGIRAQRGGDWTQGAVSKVLRCPTYIGVIRVNGETYQGVHEPIIDPETWQKADQLRQAGERTKRGKTPTANHLLGGGMLWCPGCGSSMYAAFRPRRGAGVGWEAYMCSRRAQHGLRACDVPPLRRGPIDEAVWRFVTDTALDLEATKQALMEQSDARLAESSTLQLQAEREALKAHEELARVRVYFREGRISPEEWREERDELTEELEAANARVERLERQHRDLIAARSEIDAESAVLAELTAIRASVLGEARKGGREGADAFRAALRRMFVGFEAFIGPGFSYGRRHVGRESIIWANDPPTAGDLVLLPHVRPEAMDLAAARFPALKRTPLAVPQVGVRRSDAVALIM